MRTSVQDRPMWSSDTIEDETFTWDTSLDATNFVSTIFLRQPQSCFSKLHSSIYDFKAMGTACPRRSTREECVSSTSIC